MADLLWLNRGTLLFLATLALGLACWRKGAAPERIVAGVLLGTLLADRLYHLIASGGETLWTVSDYTRIDIGHFLIDLSATVMLVSLGLVANRIYTLWIGGTQIIALFSHMGAEMGQTIHPVAYAAMNRAIFYLQFALLAAGLWNHIRRVRKIGPYRSWRQS